MRESCSIAGIRRKPSKAGRLPSEVLKGLSKGSIRCMVRASREQMVSKAAPSGSAPAAALETRGVHAVNHLR